MNEIRQISDSLYSLTCHLIGTTTHQVRYTPYKTQKMPTIYTV